MLGSKELLEEALGQVKWQTSPSESLLPFLSICDPEERASSESIVKDLILPNSTPWSSKEAKAEMGAG
jgi:hypothetical protein